MKPEDNNDIARWVQLAAVLDGIIAGTVTLTEGCRQVFELGHVLKQDGNELFGPFSGFYSESDAFPIGEVRKLWAPDSLLLMDQKREATEQHYRDWIMDAAVKFRRFVATKINQ